MKYGIVYRKRASLEYADALLWYKKRSPIAAQKFLVAIEETLDKVANAPTRYRNTYLSFYEVSVVRFPYLVIYFIDEDARRIVIVSIFHVKRSLRNKFREW